MITESLDEVIKMPDVCPGVTHKTNEAEFFQLGYTVLFRVLVSSIEQERLLQQLQLDKQLLWYNREKSATYTVALKRQIQILQMKGLSKTYEEKYFCMDVKTQVNFVFHLSPQGSELKHQFWASG